MSYGYGGAANPFDQRDDGGGGGYGGSNRYGGGGGYGSPQQSYRAPQQVRQPPAAFGQGPRPGGGGGNGPARYNSSPSMGYDNSPSKEQYSPGSEQYNNSPSMGRDDYGSGNVEMASLAQNASSPATANPQAFLTEINSISGGIDALKRNFGEIKTLQLCSLKPLSQSEMNRTTQELDALSAQTLSKIRQLTERVRHVKSGKEGQMPRNAPQVRRVDSNLKAAITDFQVIESDFSNIKKEQAKRQYRIVDPGASEAEVNAAFENSGEGQMIFQQALTQNDRQGQARAARAALSAVQDRRAELEKIARQIKELADLINHMDTLVEQQDVQIINIEQKGEEVVENLDKGNDEMKTAVVTARKTRKKKWICLGICVTIVVIIVVAVVAYVMINRSANGAKKRSIDDLVRRSIEWGPEGPPVAAVYAQSKIVTADAEAGPKGAPLSHFGRSMRHGKRYIIVDTDDLPGVGSRSPAS